MEYENTSAPKNGGFKIRLIFVNTRLLFIKKVLFNEQNVIKSLGICESEYTESLIRIRPFARMDQHKIVKNYHSRVKSELLFY